MCVFLFFLSYVCLIVYLLNRWCIFVTSHLSHSQSTTNTKQCDAYLASLRIASKSTEVLLYYFFLFLCISLSLLLLVLSYLPHTYKPTNSRHSCMYTKHMIPTGQSVLWLCHCVRLSMCTVCCAITKNSYVAITTIIWWCLCSVYVFVWEMCSDWWT